MSELFPAKTIALEYVECTDKSNEWNFNYWFRTVHISDLLKIPGIANVYRYRSLGVVRTSGHLYIQGERKEGQSTYLTVYRLDSNDPFRLMQKLVAEERVKLKEQGRMIDSFQSNLMSVWSFMSYRRTVAPLSWPETHLPDGMPDAMLVVPTMCTNPARRFEANDWYFNIHFHDLLETPGLVQAHRYTNLDPNPKKGDAEYLALYEIESPNPSAVIQQILEDDGKIRAVQGRLIDFIIPPYAFELYQHIDL